MSDHNPNACPNKQLIDTLRLDLNNLGGKVVEMDKSNAVDNAVLKNQYETIIGMLTQQGKENAKINNRMGEFEKAFAVNDYKTNQATTFIDRVTWGLVAKIGTILAIAGVVVSAVANIWKG